MTDITAQVRALVNRIDPEFRVPVMDAFANSDGSVQDFHQELAAQTWDYPSLPVQDIMDQLTVA